MHWFSYMHARFIRIFFLLGWSPCLVAVRLFCLVPLLVTPRNKHINLIYNIFLTRMLSLFFFKVKFLCLVKFRLTVLFWDFGRRWCIVTPLLLRNILGSIDRSLFEIVKTINRHTWDICLVSECVWLASLTSWQCFLDLWVKTRCLFFLFPLSFSVLINTVIPSKTEICLQLDVILFHIGRFA